MNRRGQIFLIMTILVITFMVGITAILFDVRRADYFDPAPDSDVTLQAWETTINALEQMMDVQLAISSQSILVDGIYSVDFSVPLNQIELYLNDRGFSASIENTTVPTFTLLDIDTSSTSVSISSRFQIFVSSTSTQISQDIEITISYNADYIAGNNEVYISKQVNLENREYITDATASNINVINNLDGSYDTSLVSSPNPVTFTTSTNVQLGLTV